VIITSKLLNWNWNTKKSKRKFTPRDEPHGNQKTIKQKENMKINADS